MTYYRSLGEVVAEHVTWARSDHPRVGTGYPIMDARTEGGAADGEVILFTSRPQVGKTTFGLNVIVNNCPLPAVMFSLEMHARYIAARLAAMHSEVPTWEIERAIKEKGGHPALDRLIADYPHLAIIDKPGMSLKDMIAAVNECSDQWGTKPRLIVIDFLELIGGVPTLSQVEQVDKVARNVKNFSRETDTVVLLLHQVGRGEGGAGELPLSLASGRYGGEMSADYVLGAYRPCLRPGITSDEYQREVGNFYLQFLKTRGGSQIHPSGLLHRLDSETMRIRPNDLQLPNSPELPYASQA